MPCTKYTGTNPTLKEKNRNNLREWREKIKQAADGMIPVVGTCNVDICFYLSPKQYVASTNAEAFYGPDIDNLLKVFLDPFTETSLMGRKGSGKGDSRIVGLRAIKRKAFSPGEVGAHFRIVPTITLKIVEVKTVRGAALDPAWQHDMQIIYARMVGYDERGGEILGGAQAYIDNTPGQLFATAQAAGADAGESAANEQFQLGKKYPQINPGFDWAQAVNKSVEDIIVFKQGKYYWINAWE